MIVGKSFSRLRVMWLEKGVFETDNEHCYKVSVSFLLTPSEYRDWCKGKLELLKK